jgi:undecaprenyl-diphosphatase
MSSWVAVLLGLVEGLTEFLPVSSTGHLLLVEHALNLGVKGSEMFNAVIQCGAVLAVLFAFYERLRKLWRDRQQPGAQSYVLKIGTAFVVTAAGVLIFKNLGLKLPENPQPVAWATLIGGVVILGLEWRLRGRTGRDDVTWTIAVVAGLAQVIAAAYPGTSRSGASIVLTMAFGLARPAAIEFSFLLGVPTLLAAGGFTVFSAIRHHETPPEPIGQILLATAVAAVTAFLAVRWLLKFVQSHTLMPFGWYRIALGAIILVAMH